MAKPVRISQATWRRLQRAMEMPFDQARGIAGRPRSADIVKIRNDTGATVARFGVLGIGGAAFDPDSQPEAFQRQIVLAGVAPNDQAHSLGRFVIALQPLAAGQVGDAVAAGVCQVKLNVADEAALFADIQNSDTTALKAAQIGPCAILYKQTGTGIRWAIVKHGGVGAGNVEKVEWIKLYQTATHPMQGQICRFNPASGAWTDLPGLVAVYRYPTHTSNAMYKVGTIENPARIAAAKIADGVYIALHSVPREVELYVQELP